MRFLTLAVAVLSMGVLAAGVTSCSESYAEAELRLPTLQCDNCIQNVTKALEKVDGVARVDVDLEGKKATVQYRADKTGVAQLEDAVVNAGYAANDKKADPEAYAELANCCKLK